MRALTKSCEAEAGFTLLELLIATTVLGFLSLLLFGGLQFGTRVWEKTQTSATDTNHVRAAQLSLSEDFARSIPFYREHCGRQTCPFPGRRPAHDLFRALEVAAADGSGDRSGPAGQGQRLGPGEARRVELEGGRDVPTHHTLISGLKWVQISYYGAPQAGRDCSRDPAHTMPRSDSARMPRRNLPLRRNGRRYGAGSKPCPAHSHSRRLNGKAPWPDLVVSPRTDVDDPACWTNFEILSGPLMASPTLSDSVGQFRGVAGRTAGGMAARTCPHRPRTARQSLGTRWRERSPRHRRRRRARQTARARSRTEIGRAFGTDESAAREISSLLAGSELVPRGTTDVVVELSDEDVLRRRFELPAASRVDLGSRGSFRARAAEPRRSRQALFRFQYSRNRADRRSRPNSNCASSSAAPLIRPSRSRAHRGSQSRRDPLRR